MNAEGEIRALLDRRIAALREKDPAAAVAALAGDIVAFEMVGPLAQPSEAVTDEAATAAWMASWVGPITVEMRDLKIHASEAVGVAYALHHLSGERQGGARTDLWMRSTLAFERRGEAWQIVHAHTSVPFDPANGFKASVDLTP